MGGHLKDRVEAEANRNLRERVERLRQAFEEALSGASEPMRFPLTPGEWGAASGAAQLHVIRDAVESIARHESQREILSALLDAAAAIYPRTALFIVKGSTLAGWAGLGFLGEGGFKSEHVARLTLSAAGHHVLARAASGRTVVRASAQSVGEEVRAALGGIQPADACAAPVQVRGRPVAILYGDTGGATEGGDPLAFEILARVAAMAMERLAGSHRKARAGAEAAAGPPGPAPHAAPHPPGGSVTPPEEAEMQAILADLGGHPRSASADDGQSDEERRRLADARRFAHLLISELLLYNEAAVIQGRKHRDLYARLRKEIDRSRQAFQTRFPALVAGQNDYFSQELVRTLAQGDRGLLGS
jgi:hypothetical protein